VFCVSSVFLSPCLLGPPACECFLKSHFGFHRCYSNPFSLQAFKQPCCSHSPTAQVKSDVNRTQLAAQPSLIGWLNHVTFLLAVIGWIQLEQFAAVLFRTSDA